APPVVFKNEADLVALVERTDACRLEGTRMHKHVLGAILWLDEAESLCGVEKLHDSCGAHPLSFPDRRNWPVKAAPSARKLKSGERQMPVRAKARPQLVRRPPQLGAHRQLVFGIWYMVWSVPIHKQLS